MSAHTSPVTPFLLITSLQAKHYQALTHSFAQRDLAIFPVFCSFRTLLTLTGVHPPPLPVSYGEHLSLFVPTLDGPPAKISLCWWQHSHVGNSFSWHRTDLEPESRSQPLPKQNRRVRPTNRVALHNASRCRTATPLPRPSLSLGVPNPFTNFSKPHTRNGAKTKSPAW